MRYLCSIISELKKEGLWVAEWKQFRKICKDKPIEYVDEIDY